MQFRLDSNSEHNFTQNDLKTIHKKFKFAPSIMGCKPWQVLEYVKEFERHNIDMIHFDVMDGHYVPNITIGSQEFRAIHEVSKLPIDLHLMTFNPYKTMDYFDIKKGDRVSFHPDALCESKFNVDPASADDKDVISDIYSSKSPVQVIDKIHKKGAKAGIAINPDLDISIIDSVKSCVDFIIVMAVKPGFSGQKMLDSHFDKLKEVVYRVNHINNELANSKDKLLHNSHQIKEVIVDGNVTPKTVVDNAKCGAIGFVVGNSFLPWESNPKDFHIRYNNFMQVLSYIV